MPSFRALVLLHGYAFLFCWIFVVQAGVPVPADPVLLLMGATVGDGHYSFPLALGASVTAALLGDSIWYELGRRRGHSVLALLCRFSLEPDTCIRNAELRFSKRGAWSLVFAKFIPGLGLISTPLAGAMKMPRSRFLLADAAGALLWCTTYLTVGVLFRRQIDQLINALGLFGQRAGIILFLLLVAYVGWRLLQRWRFRWQLRINRVSPAEAHALLEGDGPVMIIDLRDPADIEKTGLKIKGAIIKRPSELRTFFQEFPCEHEVILYCT